MLLFYLQKNGSADQDTIYKTQLGTFRTAGLVRNGNALFLSLYVHACGANYPSQERAISPAARTTLHQGGSNFACGANYPHQAIKGGYFVFVWRVGTWLDLT